MTDRIRSWRRSRRHVIFTSALVSAWALTGASSGQDFSRLKWARPELTAHRPQNGTGYTPFSRTPVPDEWETDALLGPGIRRNLAGEIDPSSEDDLIELTVDRGIAGASLTLGRSASELLVWTTRNKQPGTQLVFVGNLSNPVAFPSGAQTTLWVEWTGNSGGLADLTLQLESNEREFDRLTFHVFDGLVVALGGEDQVPSLPVDPNHGTYITATELYERGYDVLMRDEDEVSSTGAGLVYNEITNAILHRGVGHLAIFGYSHGGGSTYHLTERLAANSGTLGTFTIEFTSYSDGVRNNSNVDMTQEQRRPIGSAFHVNHYQHGTLFEDFLLDGGPVNNSSPAPTGLDVETTPWGAGATHFLVDDYAEVIDYNLVHLQSRLGR